MTTPDHSYATDDSPRTAPARGAALWEDFVDIFYAPSQVYERRAQGGFGIPMLIVSVMGAAIFFATWNATAPAFEADIARATAAAARQPGVTEAQLSAMQGAGQTMIKVMAVIGAPILIFMTGLALWLVGKLVSATQTLGAAIMVAAYANVPRLLGGLLSGTWALLADPASLTGRYALGFSPARFMDPDGASPVLLLLAGRLDLFTIWATALLAIGLAVTGRIPRAQAAVAAVLVWVCGTLPELAGALRE